MTNHAPGPERVPDAMSTDCAFCEDNLHAYSLGALIGFERSRVEQHLLWCGRCRRAHADIRRVTDLLPFLSEVSAPSPKVKARLFSQIADSETGTGDTPVILPNPWAAVAAPSAPVEQPAGTLTGAWQRWMLSGLIAPLAICLIVLAAWTNSLHNEVSDLRASGGTQPVATTANLPQADLQLYDFRPACPECEERQASGQLGGSPDGSVGVVVAWNLDPDAKHQVWCINSQGEKLLVSDLEVEQTGSVFQTVSFPQPLGGYQQIYVARHDGTPDPDAELLVAMNEEHEVDPPNTPAEDSAAD